MSVLPIKVNLWTILPPPNAVIASDTSSHPFRYFLDRRLLIENRPD